MSENETIGVEEEFDLSDAGVQTRRVIATITGFDVEEKDNGVQHVVTFEVENDEEIQYPITVRNWFSHSNEKAQQIGRGNLKQISQAALGTPKYNQTNLLGRQVDAQVYDNEGFVGLRRFRKVKQAQE
jgi:hypothetical protein